MARIVAAIDFGMHGTGFAWAFSSAQADEPGRRQIYTFDDWTAQPTTYVKNLSAILLDGSGDVIAWGYDAKKRFQSDGNPNGDREYAERFKMGLLPTESGPTSVPSAPSRSPRELVTAYLKGFYRFALDRIMAGSGVTEDEILWCLTVPAIWKDRERQIMRECAVDAGLPADPDRLLIAVEPEVAALYCRFDSGHAEVGAEGERFMVVDAGGGTVDITAFEKTRGGLREIGFTDGGTLGSTYIDRHLLETLIPKRLGVGFVEAARSREPAAFTALMDDWERAKRGFDPAENRPTVLQLSYRLFRILTDADRSRLGDVQNGPDDELVITAAEMAGMFEHVVEPILALVDEQISRIGRQSVDRVLLVGGFAQSPYLQQRLREHLRDRVEVVIPAKPSWAVLLGAVHYGLAPAAIHGRRSRFTYGVQIALPFDPIRDSDEHKAVKYDGTVLCTNRLDAFVEAGEIVVPGHSVVRRYFPITAGQREITIRLFTAETGRPRSCTDSSCSQVGKLTVDMSVTASLPPEDRCVEVTLLFGGTEVTASARDVKTGGQISTSIQFS